MCVEGLIDFSSRQANESRQHSLNERQENNSSSIPIQYELINYYCHNTSHVSSSEYFEIDFR